MATLNEISYSILSQCYNFNISDDIDVDLDWIYYQISVIRNNILQKEKQAFAEIEWEKYYSRLNCVPVECVDVAECCEIQTDCYIRKIKLPSKMLYPDKSLIQSVTRKYSFDYTKPHLINHYLNRRIRVSKGYWYYENENLYLVSDVPNIELVSIFGIFENPESLKSLQDCNEKPCYDPKTENYPMEAKHIPFVEQYVVNLIRSSLTNVKDLTNNAMDDAINTVRGDMESLNNQLNSITPNR